MVTQKITIIFLLGLRPGEAFEHIIDQISMQTQLLISETNSLRKFFYHIN